MACIVTVKDIKDRIRNEVKDAFDSSRFTSYTDRLAAFIPYDAANPSTSKLYGDVKKLERSINKRYQAKHFGTLASTESKSDGVVLNIYPSRTLAQAMTQQNEQDESFSSRETQYQQTQSISNEGEVVTEKVIRELASSLSHRIGIKYNIINDANQKYKGKLTGETAYINLAYATLDTPIHEIVGHPIIKAIKNAGMYEAVVNGIESKDSFDSLMGASVQYNGKDYVLIDNRNEVYGHYDSHEEAQNIIDEVKRMANQSTVLYENLLKELEYGIGKEVFDRIKKDYDSKTDYAIVPYEDENYKVVGYNVSSTTKQKSTYYNNIEDAQKALDLTKDEYSLEEQQEEALVELLGMMTAQRLDSVRDSKLISLLKRLIKEMKVYVKSLLSQKQIEIEKLPDDMTISDLADVLAYSNSKLILPGYSVEYTTPDNFKFVTYQEASNHITKLVKQIEEVDLDGVTVDVILTPEEEQKLRELKQKKEDLENYRISEEYQRDKFLELVYLNEELIALQNKEVVFFDQEVTLQDRDINKYGFQDFTFVRTESTYSRWNMGSKPHSEILGEDYEGYYIHGYNTSGLRDTKILPISKEEAQAIFDSQEDTANKRSHEDRQEIYKLNDKINRLNRDTSIANQLFDLNKDITRIESGPLEGYIASNHQFEQSKEVIEEWKKVNNIVYNPEEVYSRGQEFSSVVGAYSDFDVNLMMQNLLAHIEDNQKAGGEFSISAYTKPIDKQIGHLEGGGGKIKFKIYPQSEDIKWASNVDAYSGSVWDAAKKIDPNKQSELLGVSYSKYPSLGHLDTVQPNLANIIDDIDHHHNELGISLTGTNFRLEYDEDIPTKTKKILDSINSILDQKYGKLVTPKYNPLTNQITQEEFAIIMDGIEQRRVFSMEEAESFIKLHSSNWGYSREKYQIEKIVVSRGYKGIAPTQTRQNIKENIRTTKSKIIPEIFTNFKISPGPVGPGMNWAVEYSVEYEHQLRMEIEFFSTKEEAQNFIEESKKKNGKAKKYTGQALVNVKVAKLKSVAKKYPRSLIRSEVKRDASEYGGYESMHSIDTLDDLWQKIPSSENESFSKHEQQNVKRPITDNFVEYKRYKEAQLNKVKQALRALHRDRKNPKKDVKATVAQIDRLNNIEAKIKNDIDSLDKNEVALMFHAIDSDIQDLNKVLDNLNYADNKYDVEDIKARLEFLFKLVKGRSVDNKDQSNIESLKNYNHPDFDRISLAVDDLNTKYQEKLAQLRDAIISSDITYVNNVQDNTEITPEQLKNMFNAKNDLNWFEATFLGITSSSNNDTILPQILKSFLETKVALREAEVKIYQDRLQAAINKLKDKGEKFDFIFERTPKGNRTGNIINVISPLFNKMLYQYSKISSDTKKTSEEIYKEKVKWLKQHTNVIDFRKLKDIRNLYGTGYAEHFTYSEEEMDRYEVFLRDALGPLYDEEIAKVMNSLENFQLQKESLLADTNNRFRFRDVARIDPWAFVANYNTPQAYDRVNFNAGGINTEAVYSDIQNVRFIPIKDMYVGFDTMTGDEIYRDSGYYNKDFDAIQQDPAKLEYWRVMKEIYSDYVNPLYNESSVADMSYAKFEEEFLESIASAKGLLKGTELYKQSKRAFKSMFYERGREHTVDGVAQNYSDRSSQEIKEFSDVLRQKTPEALANIAVENGIEPDGMTYNDLIREIATKQVVDSYSADINKVTSALLEMSALQKARQDTLPVANLILDSHKIASSDRKRSIDRMEQWINRVIKGDNEKYRGSANMLGKNITKRNWLGNMLDRIGNIPFIGNYINRKRTYLLSDNEKVLLQYLKDLQNTGHNKEVGNTFKYNDVLYSMKKTEAGPSYFEIVGKDVRPISEQSYEKAFQGHIQEKIEELGLDLNAAGVVQGILKMIILKGLGLNPISGIFNRLEGKNSGLIMDQTGNYWTKGNIHNANNFLAFANFMKFLPERFTPQQAKKVQELKKLQTLIHNMNIIQDRKNELERQGDKSKFNYAEKLNIFQFAVDNPEFKNQGAILLSILEDTKIKDSAGNLVPIFDGTGFPAYDVIDDRLVLKPQFRSPENISNWENFDIDEVNLKNNQYILTKNKIKHAISRSQGNYDSLDVIEATKNIWGRALTIFMKWMPEHAMQRFSSGTGTDLINDGKQKAKGRYRYLFDNHPALFTTGVLTLFTAFGLTPVVGWVALGFTGVVALKYLTDTYGKGSIRREASNTMEFVEFAKSIVISTLNYPLELVNSPKTIKLNTYSKSNLSQEEINNLQAVARELGIKLSFMVLLLIAKRATWDDDDEKDSDERQLHNFLDNQLSRMITSLSNWLNPEALVSDVQRMAFLKYLWSVGALCKSLIELDTAKATDNAFKVSPIPRLLHKGSAPWHDEKEYDADDWMDKMVKAEGPKQAIKDLKEQREDEIRAELSTRYEGEVLEKKVKSRMRKEIPTKSAGMTYKEVLEIIESGEKNPNSKKKKEARKKRKLEEDSEEE